MGLLTGLLTLPLAPVRGVDWLARRMAEEADRELCATSQIRAELRSLAVAADAGLLTDEEFERAEEQLLDRLERAEQFARTDGSPPYRPRTWGNQ